MPTLFTRIIEGELPGRFVYRDERCVAFLTIEPISHGHTLVVPIEEVDHWIDLDPELASHCFSVAQRVGRAIDEARRTTSTGSICATGSADCLTADGRVCRGPRNTEAAVPVPSSSRSF